MRGRERSSRGGGCGGFQGVDHVVDLVRDRGLDGVAERPDDLPHMDRAAGRELLDDPGDEGAVPGGGVEVAIGRCRVTSGEQDVDIREVDVTSDPRTRVCCDRSDRRDEERRSMIDRRHRRGSGGRFTGETGIEHDDVGTRPGPGELPRPVTLPVDGHRGVLHRVVRPHRVRPHRVGPHRVGPHRVRPHRVRPHRIGEETVLDELLNRRRMRWARRTATMGEHRVVRLRVVPLGDEHVDRLERTVDELGQLPSPLFPSCLSSRDGLGISPGQAVEASCGLGPAQKHLAGHVRESLAPVRHRHDVGHGRTSAHSTIGLFIFIGHTGSSRLTATLCSSAAAMSAASSIRRVRPLATAAAKPSRSSSRRASSRSCRRWSTSAP